MHSQGETLTFFTIPKPFRGHFDVIQRNAIRSWTLLRPACEIILMGDEEGTEEAAREYGLRHIAGIAQNDYGIPLLDDLFYKAQQAASHEWLCFVNADIILPNDFMAAFEQTRRSKDNFLMAGRRWDLDVKELLDFRTDWQTKMRAAVAQNGRRGSEQGADFFVFRRNAFGEIPPFAVGRVSYDNWLIYRARRLRIPVVDATNFVLSVHQNHNRVDSGPTAQIRSPLADRNRELRRRELGMDYVFNLRDATHVVSSAGVRFAWANLARYLLWTVGFTWPITRLLALGHKASLSMGLSSRARRARRRARKASDSSTRA